MVREWLDSWQDRLSSLASRLESALAAKCSVWSHSLGECTTYDGHTLGLECALAGSTPEKLQVLVLEFRIRAMTSQPFMEKATLVWTSPTSSLASGLPMSAGHLQGPLRTGEAHMAS